MTPKKLLPLLGLLALAAAGFAWLLLRSGSC
jgi:hypothetical protein